MSKGQNALEVMLGRPGGVNPHFHFAFHFTNLLMVAVISIYAGFNSMKTLWRSTPNG
jgi:hypothetical protein